MIIEIEPMGAVRQSRKDAWDPRPAVVRYRAFRDELRLKMPGYQLPDELPFITFHISMPKSWSKKKTLQMWGEPHQSKPDLDNLIKAFKDALAVDDAHVWRYAGAQKLWAVNGAIGINETARKTG